jgi:hypothetical protein
MQTITVEKPVRVTHKETAAFVRRLRSHLFEEIHLKIEGDDTPITYILKEMGRDYIVVVFAQIERVIPISRIIFFQTEIRRCAF